MVVSYKEVENEVQRGGTKEIETRGRSVWLLQVAVSQVQPQAYKQEIERSRMMGEPQPIYFVRD